MSHGIQPKRGRRRWLLPVLAVGAMGLLSGCVAYPDYGYGYGSPYYYGGYPYGGYPAGGYAAFSFGGDWDHGWHGDHDWRGGDHDWHGRR